MKIKEKAFKRRVLNLNDTNYWTTKWTQIFKIKKLNKKTWQSEHVSNKTSKWEKGYKMQPLLFIMENYVEAFYWRIFLTFCSSSLICVSEMHIVMFNIHVFHIRVEFTHWFQFDW